MSFFTLCREVLEHAEGIQGDAQSLLSWTWEKGGGVNKEIESGAEGGLKQ